MTPVGVGTSDGTGRVADTGGPPGTADCGMDVTAELDAEIEPDRLFSVVADLGTYPKWLEIVAEAQPVEERRDDGGPAWSVDLRGQLGPFRRSKRLRMVRSELVRPATVVFTRREIDGRTHSDWTLRATIVARDHRDDPGVTPVRLTMELHYGGSLWVPLLDRLLADEVERSRSRLLLVAGGEG